MNEAKILSQKLFGEASRFALVEFHTRLGTVEYFVKDAQVCDERGYSKVVFQTSSKEYALARYGYKELESVGIVHANPVYQVNGRIIQPLTDGIVIKNTSNL